MCPVTQFKRRTTQVSILTFLDYEVGRVLSLVAALDAHLQVSVQWSLAQTESALTLDNQSQLDPAKVEGVISVLLADEGRIFDIEDDLSVHL